VRILVTGGAGFIGSHVCDAYMERGHELLVVDDLSSGKRENLPAGVELIEADIRDTGFGDIVGRFSPEVVNHLAAQISVTRSVSEPVFDADVNVAGLANVLSACADHGVRRFIFSSSGGALYGETDDLPARESTPVRPLAPYGVSKYCGEHYVDYFGMVSDMTTVILRYGNVFGPRQDPFGEAGVVAIFAEALLKGRTPTIFGSGEQTRDFVYVEDVARANLAALDAPGGTCVNIGSGRPTSVNHIYEALVGLTGSDIQARRGPQRPGEVKNIYLDATSADALLGWRAEVQMDQGLERTVEFFRHV
jgi:UDP-glucose 4-epimerase